MLKHVALVLIFTAAATTAFAGPVRRAGEWQNTIGDRPPQIVCFPQDTTLDQNYVTKAMGRVPGAVCTLGDLSTAGNVTKYTMHCTVNGSEMTTNGTITAMGPDAFTSQVQSHGGVVKMSDGKLVPFPDSDTKIESRRLGDCKPGDRQITY